MNVPEPQGKEVNTCIFILLTYRGQSVMQVKEWSLDIHQHSISAVVLKETVYSREISIWH